MTQPKKRTVMSFGTFDHFHAGHESYLKQAKAFGEFLIVIIARDETVERIKGRPPYYNEKKRRAAVVASRIAEKVVLGNPGNKYKVLLKYKPDVIALGYDQFAFTFRLEKFLIDNGINAKVIRLNPYRPAMYKSSLMRTAYEHV